MNLNAPVTVSKTRQRPMSPERLFAESDDTDQKVRLFSNHDGFIHSSSLSTVQFCQDGNGTTLVYSEIMVAPSDGGDSAEGRKKGWDRLLSNLAKEMEYADA